MHTVDDSSPSSTNHASGAKVTVEPSCCLPSRANTADGSVRADLILPSPLTPTPPNTSLSNRPQVVADGEVLALFRRRSDAVLLDLVAADFALCSLLFTVVRAIAAHDSKKLHQLPPQICHFLFSFLSNSDLGSKLRNIVKSQFHGHIIALHSSYLTEIRYLTKKGIGCHFPFS